MAELFQKAGLPDGVLNVIHGSVETAFICDNEDIRAISFVSSELANIFMNVEQRMEKGCRQIWEQKTMQLYYQMLTKGT